MEHRCSEEEWKAIKSNLNQILLKECEVKRARSYGLCLITCIEAGFVAGYVKGYLSEQLAINLIGGIVSIVGTIVLFYFLPLLLGFVNVWMIESIRKKRQKRCCLRLHDITINGAEIVKGNGFEMSYIEDDLLDDKKHPVVITETFIKHYHFIKKNKRLVIIRGKDRKNTLVTQVMVANDEIKKYIGSNPKKATRKEI